MKRGLPSLFFLRNYKKGLSACRCCSCFPTAQGPPTSSQGLKVEGETGRGRKLASVVVVAAAAAAVEVAVKGDLAALHAVSRRTLGPPVPPLFPGKRLPPCRRRMHDLAAGRVCTIKPRSPPRACFVCWRTAASGVPSCEMRTRTRPRSTE